MTNDFPGRDEILNQELQQLIEEAKQYPFDSQNPQERTKRRIALTKLIDTIQHSGRLSKQIRWSEIPNYEDYYDEALQQAFIEICESIGQYNSQYPVMAWVNTIFNGQFFDVVEKARKRGIKWLPRNPEAAQVLSLDELNKDLPLENEVSEEEQLKEIVEADPEKFLTNEYIKENPQANLKAIVLLILEGNQWKEIAEELAVPLSTVSTFYQRRMGKIISYLKRYLED